MYSKLIDKLPCFPMVPCRILSWCNIVQSCSHSEPSWSKVGRHYGKAKLPLLISTKALTSRPKVVFLSSLTFHKILQGLMVVSPRMRNSAVYIYFHIIGFPFTHCYCCISFSLKSGIISYQQICSTFFIVSLPYLDGNLKSSIFLSLK